MTQSSTQNQSTESAPPTPKGTGALESTHGRTTVSDSVVQKIAGIAAREVSGVHNLGGGSSRVFGALRERIPGSSGPSAAQGVSVEVGTTQAAIDLDIVVEYGVSIAELSKAVRRNVITATERMTGLQVVEVNIAVDDVFIQGQDDSQPEPPSRVQ